MEFIVTLFLITASFVVIWIGSGFVIKSIEFIAKKSHISSFLISFFVLGVLTSVPELGIAFASVQSGATSVSIGNLIGGILVLLFVIIPVYAIITKGVVLKEESEKKIFNETLLCLLLPFAVIFDRKIDSFDALILLLGYGFLIYKTYQGRDRSIDKEINKIIQDQSSLIEYLKHSFRIIFGIVIVLIASNFLIDRTVYLSGILNADPFITSLLLLAFGTNLPEISLMVRSIAARDSEIALGNYLGSAVANVIIIAFVVFFGGAVNLQNNTTPLITYAVIAMSVFFLAFRLNNKLSSYEGITLLASYMLFLGFEFFIIS